MKMAQRRIFAFIDLFSEETLLPLARQRYHYSIPFSQYLQQTL